VAADEPEVGPVGQGGGLQGVVGSFLGQLAGDDRMAVTSGMGRVCRPAGQQSCSGGGAVL